MSRKDTVTVALVLALMITVVLFGTMDNVNPDLMYNR